MISQSEKPRNVLPRWRPLNKTIESKELDQTLNLRRKSEKDTIPDIIFEKSRKWMKNRNTITAYEFVEAAVVYGHAKYAADAARFLISSESDAADLVRKNAAILLQKINPKHALNSDDLVPNSENLAAWRSRIRAYPADPLAWVELALCQIIERQDRDAKRSMTVALQLAPENRHVLRSASRLYVHLGDADRAHDLVRLNTRTPHDPWLVAAEIALAEQAGRKSRFITDGIRALEASTHRPRHMSELASAVATKLLRDGNRKRGKRLFGASLVDPTENSLAQAQWASKNFGEDFVTEYQISQNNNAHEAAAYHSYWGGNFKKAFYHAKQWHNEEPFSTRALQAAITPASLMEDYTTAKFLSFEAIKMQQESIEIINGLTFSLICLGEFLEAQKYLNLLKYYSQKGTHNSYVTIANIGLFEMRTGKFESGAAHYDSAIEGFQNLQHPSAELLARAYFAREAAIAKLPNAEYLLTKAKQENATRNFADVAYVLATAERIIAARLSDPPSQQGEGDRPRGPHR